LLLYCLNTVHGQPQPSFQPRFAGCYEVASLVWNPPDKTIRLIPTEFQLLNETWERNRAVYKMRSVPPSSNPVENLWAWEPKGDRVWVSWSTGLGGFKGTLRASRSGELLGKLKEWCDFRCEWKKRTGAIRLRKIDCADSSTSVRSQ
jgi:hypothetical protein